VILDLFAGPGGWDVGARSLGLDPLGVEWDDDACATRDAAGLRTLQADVAALDPADFAPCEGLIASPPCQTFSSAGRHAGVRDAERVAACMADLAAGRDTRAVHRDAITDSEEAGALFAFATTDTRSLLVVEPLRFALALQPRWIALEQVPPVLPLWDEMARLLAGAGWLTWTGLVRADAFGVPQTRERAVLLAHAERRPQAPAETHQRWSKGRAAVQPADAEGRLPWRSMAEACGWREAAMVGFPRRNDRTAGDGGAYRERDLRRASEPAFHVTGKVRSWTRDGEMLTDAEASVLQGFPADYPWQGSRSSRMLQLANAVPPPMARAILAALVGDRGEAGWTDGAGARTRGASPSSR
jgi:DNA (cytosine-5)-methyltransferase 1